MLPVRKVHGISRVRSGWQAGAKTSWGTPKCHRNRILLQATPNIVAKRDFALYQVNRVRLFIQYIYQMWFILCHHNKCKFKCLPPWIPFVFLWIHYCYFCSLACIKVSFGCFQIGRETHENVCWEKIKFLFGGYIVSNVDKSLITVRGKGARNQQYLEEFNEGEHIWCKTFRCTRKK